MKRLFLLCTLLSVFFSNFQLSAQTTQRPRPAEWNNLIFGGRFMDRFLPMTNNGKPARSDAWGADNVLPRYVENGIEHKDWSLWCANVVKEGDKYHMYVVGWREDSPRGHATWPNSILFHAIGDNMVGPFTITDTIGKGHNAEGFKLKDGRWIVYVINGYYVADGPEGPWTYKKFDFQPRDRKIMDGLSNCTFAKREDGSYLMVNRGGGTWYSQTGETPYYQISEKSAYPPIRGNFEDPVVWRDNVQYNLVVNDWLGRIAYYLRSKDGVEWKVEAGEAYLPGISKHADGTVEEWHKYERMRVFQDEHGRAVQAYFAVIDVEKNLDKGSDIHSSKVIAIPLQAGRLMTIMDKKKVDANTKTIRLKIAAEKDFNPQTDIDLASLHFGGPEEVNFGKGATKVVKTEKSGKDLIITFHAAGHGIPEDDYAAKLIGKTKDGKLLYGYARLPWVSFNDPILSARMPEITSAEKGAGFKTEVQNFGQYASKNATLKISSMENGQEVLLASGKIPALKPFEKTTVSLSTDKTFDKGTEYSFVVTIEQNNIKPVLLHGKLTPSK